MVSALQARPTEQQRNFPLNAIFFAIVLIAFVVAGFQQLTWTPPAPDAAAPAQGPMQELGTAMIDAATGSVTLALGLIGVMALFLGLMKVAEEGGLLRDQAQSRPGKGNRFGRRRSAGGGVAGNLAGAVDCQLRADGPRRRPRHGAEHPPRPQRVQNPMGLAEPDEGPGLPGGALP